MEVRHMRQPLRHRGPALLGSVLLGCLVVTACGGSGGDTATGTSTTRDTAGTAAAVPATACRDAAALKASVADLDRMDVPKAGRAGLQAALQDIRSRLGTLKGSAGDQWATQINELDGAVQVFQTTVGSVNSDNVLNDLPAKIQNLERIDQSWTSLEREIDQSCPNA
jgi:hypothetical protein